MKQGFSLIEFLVVIAIIGILSAAFAANFRTGDKNLAMDRAAHTVAQDIRETMGFALRTKPHSCTPTNFTGYGIRFVETDTSYIIFADCNGNRKYQPADSDESDPIALEAGIQISSVTPGNTVDILFEPPDPKVWINNVANAAPAQIVLASIDNPSITKTITVTNKGVIDVQ